MEPEVPLPRLQKPATGQSHECNPRRRKLNAVMGEVDVNY